MLWIALHWPLLALEALPEIRASTDPAVVVEPPLVCQGNSAAQALGIRPGMTVATARSCTAGLRVAERSAQAEAALIEQLALVALRYTPRVVLQPQGLALEVQASLRLFGGEQRLWDRLTADLAPWALHTGWAAAPTAEGARLLAWGDARRRVQPPSSATGPIRPPPRTRRPERAAQWLDALPLAWVCQAWSVSEPLQGLMEGLGLRSLGDLRRLPREGLARRVGPGILLRLDQAYGTAASVMSFHEPPPRFHQVCELPHATDRQDDLLIALERLLHALTGWLAARHRAALVLSLRLVHDSPRRQTHPDTCWPCRLSVAEVETEPLRRLFREHLSRQPLPAPVRRLELSLEQHVARAPQVMALAAVPPPSAGDDQAPLRVLDQLRARLGAERVLMLQPRADHRPERASAWEPVPDGGAWSHDRPPPPDGPLPPRPSWLMPQPLPLTESQGCLWHGRHRLNLRTRPERIESGWFDDTQPTRRDYHVAQGEDGRLAWVFRDHRGPEAAWFLHGWFA